MAQHEPAAPMKVSFSIPKSSLSQRRPLPHKAPSSSTDAVEYVTSVDAEAGVVLANPRSGRGVRVVPKQENSWRPEERMKNIRMEADATRSTEETFEMETMDAGPKPNVVYGLTVMRTRGDEEDGAEGPTRTISLKESEDQKLRDDLSNLPEEASLETYEELPVEEFGEALFRGMGWEKGKPIGRNAKAVVTPIEFEKRQGTLGLGAVPAPPKEINKKYIKPSESRSQRRPDLGAAESSQPRNAREPNTKLVRRGVAKGKIMSIIAGPHSGCSGEVVSIDDEGGKSSQVLVKLVKSGERVVVYDDEIADVGSWEEESAMKKMGELRTANGKSEKNRIGTGPERKNREGKPCLRSTKRMRGIQRGAIDTVRKRMRPIQREAIDTMRKRMIDMQRETIGAVKERMIDTVRKRMRATQREVIDTTRKRMIDMQREAIGTVKERTRDIQREDISAVRVTGEVRDGVIKTGVREDRVSKWDDWRLVANYYRDIQDVCSSPCLYGISPNRTKDKRKKEQK